jgi:hypothetical protein
MVVNDSTGEQRGVTTDASGFYVVPLLRPGSYRVEFAPQGFEKQIHKNITITVTQTTVLDDKLKVGGVQETVEVSDEPPMVDSTSNSLGDVITTKQVTSLPLVTRNFTQIMNLSAGVVPQVTRADEIGRGSGGTTPTSDGEGINVQGARASDNNYQMNGVNINDFSGTCLDIVIPNPDTIEEFRVQTGMYDAPCGRNAGANVDLMGGNLTQSRKINRGQTYYGGVNFLTWPDFLLGMNVTDNGTGIFSNVYYSLELLGVLTNPTHDWEASTYLQDDWKISPRLTINLGLRYEWIPPFTSGNGRATNLDLSLVNPNPDASGSYAGFTVPANYHYTVSTGVVKTDRTSFSPANDVHTLAPRIGLALNLTPATVLRAGYGIYYSSPTGESQFESVTSQPWVMLGTYMPPNNGAASFAHPFSEPIPSFSDFQSYSPSSDLSFIATAQNFRPGITQEYTLNLQTQITPKLMMELGYVGTGTNHLVFSHSVNQAGRPRPPALFAAKPQIRSTTSLCAFPMRVSIRQTLFSRSPRAAPTIMRSSSRSNRTSRTACSSCRLHLVEDHDYRRHETD